MSVNLTAYLSFDGNAREAMEFYREVFGGTLQVTTFAEFGSSGPGADQIMHSQLETPSGIVLMGSDTPPEMAFHEGPGRVGLILYGDDASALGRWFDRLAEGGSISVPLEQQMWGDTYGQCTDRFGIDWMVNVAGQGSDS